MSLAAEELFEISEEFWRAAWLEARRIGAIQDGIYCPSDDRDFVMAYCANGNPLFQGVSK